MDDQMLHHFMQDLVPHVVLTVLIIAGAWVIGLIIAAFKSRAQLKAQVDFQNRILEKFDSAEFISYLQSETGQSFFDTPANEPSKPLSKILSSIQKGTISTLVGIGLIILGNTYSAREGGNIMFVTGIIAFTTGLGFLASSLISYRLAKTWGMITVMETPKKNETNSAAS